MSGVATAVISTEGASGITELANIDVNSLPQTTALFYVGGCICKKYLSKHSCEDCTSSLTCSELNDLSDSSTVFLQQKSYNSLSSEKAGLTIPGAALVLFLNVCVPQFMSAMHMSNVCQRLATSILASADLTFRAAGACRDNFKVAVHLYVKMRVFYAVKFFNTSLAERPRNKRNRSFDFGTLVSASVSLYSTLLEQIKVNMLCNNHAVYNSICCINYGTESGGESPYVR